jgi:hypothetical protein
VFDRDIVEERGKMKGKYTAGADDWVGRLLKKSPGVFA